MKILKKPKFKKCTCRVCECVFVPTSKDIHPTINAQGETIRIRARCPVCQNMEEAVPKKRKKKSRTHRIAPAIADPVDKKEDAHGCHNCKHTDKGYDEEPCDSCDRDERDKWEKKEDRDA